MRRKKMSATKRLADAMAYLSRSESLLAGSGYGPTEHAERYKVSVATAYRDFKSIRVVVVAGMSPVHEIRLDGGCWKVFRKDVHGKNNGSSR